MSEHTIIYKNVSLGRNVTIEEFCIIGKPPAGLSDGELETVIGDNALIRSHTIIYAGNKIGENFQTGHQTLIRESNIIGSNVSIGSMSCIEHHITIENNVRIHSQAFVPEYSLLKNNCWIGPNVVLTNAKYPRSKNVKNSLVGAIIGENAKIGANSTILPGISIGNNALIGAGSVVSKDIPENKVAKGNPAVIIKDIQNIKDYC